MGAPACILGGVSCWLGVYVEMVETRSAGEARNQGSIADDLATVNAWVPEVSAGLGPVWEGQETLPDLHEAPPNWTIARDLPTTLGGLFTV